MTSARDLAAALAVCDLLYRYARGVDRRDLDLVRSCFAPGARYDGALASGTVADMLAALPAAMARYAATLHFMGEPAVTIDGDAATSETPTVAYHVLRDGGTLRTVAVRYVDRLEHGPDGWRITARRVLRCWES
ncbi:MAG TPA: nuclear transport factor 2 family protein [Candidatus Limnocylindria bacterium]|nr:nuclear transport factor 2 family protein [Candidatus Limnocylindria bacterium]